MKYISMPIDEVTFAISHSILPERISEVEAEMSCLEGKSLNFARQ